MKSFRRSENRELERELRVHRPEARSAFVSTLADELDRPTQRPSVKPRLALAGAIVVAMVTFFAIFGGAGYTTSAVSSIHISRLGQAVGQNKSQGQGNNSQGNNSQGNNSQGNNSQGNNSHGNNGPDDDQYKPGKGCGDKNHVHERENECK